MNNHKHDRAHTHNTGTDGITTYAELQTLAQQLSNTIVEGVIDTVAKEHFKQDRGHDVTQTLPDRSEEYGFKSHGFTATVLPDQRKIASQTYDEIPIVTNTLIKKPEIISDLLTDAEQLWNDTFGEYKPHATQPNHPGPFPLQQYSTDTATEIKTLYDEVVAEKNLKDIYAAINDNNYGLLANIFEMTEGELFTPGATDESIFPELTNPRTPYIDNEIAVITGESQTGTTTPSRGVIIGRDDTPTGVFAHVTDVTNLSPTRTTSKNAIRDAMGFDAEVDPWNPPESLSLASGERLRLQGDLRVERTGDISTFGVEIARRTRITEYESVLEDALDGLTISGRLIAGRDGELPIRDVVDVTVSKSGEVSLEGTTTDTRIEGLTYVAIFSRLNTGSNREYTSIDDVSFVTHSDVTGLQVTEPSRSELQSTQLAAQQTLNHITDDAAKAVNQTARDVAADVESGMNAPQQVNLPIDNHLAFVKRGYAPSVETEPVPVGVPEETTLHVEHDEHNTITVTVEPGVYEFSLLPRGLQPADERPQWPPSE